MKRAIIFLLLVSISKLAIAEKPKVSIEKLKQTSLEKTLFFPVQIQSKVQTQITADASYIVIKKLVRLGQKVQKGQALIVLRNQDMSVHYEKRILKAPISGTIASISVKDGALVSSNQNLILINDPKNLIARIEASAIDYRKLKVGLLGKLNITSLNLKEIPVKIIGIGAAVDQLTGTIPVELKILEQKNLIPGVIGLAEITLKKEAITLVKEKSLYYIGDEVFIASVKNNKIKKLKVKLGSRYKDKIQILEGLDLGSEYVTESAKFLRDDEEIQEIKKK